MLPHHVARASPAVFSALRTQLLVARTHSFAVRAATSGLVFPNHTALHARPFISRYLSSSGADSAAESASASESEVLSDDERPYTLVAPWQIDDLSTFEQEAYKKHGPKYMQHLDSDQVRRATQSATMRLRATVHLERELGENWYAINKESNKRIKKMEEEPLAEFAARRNAIPAGDNEARRALAKEYTEYFTKLRNELRPKYREEVRKELEEGKLT